MRVLRFPEPEPEPREPDAPLPPAVVEDLGRILGEALAAQFEADAGTNLRLPTRSSPS